MNPFLTAGIWYAIGLIAALLYKYFDKPDITIGDLFGCIATAFFGPIGAIVWIWVWIEDHVNLQKVIWRRKKK